MQVDAINKKVKTPETVATGQDFVKKKKTRVFRGKAGLKKGNILRRKGAPRTVKRGRG